MDALKRIVVLISSVLGVALLLMLLLFRGPKNWLGSKLTAFEAVPKNTTVIFEASETNLDTLTWQQAPIPFYNFLEPEAYRTFFEHYRAFRTAHLDGSLANRPLLFGVQAGGALGFVPFLILEGAKNLPIPELLQNASTTQLRGHLLYSWKDTSDYSLTFFFYKNLLVAGPQAFVVEDVVRHLEDQEGAGVFAKIKSRPNGWWLQPSALPLELAGFGRKSDQGFLERLKFWRLAEGHSEQGNLQMEWTPQTADLLQSLERDTFSRALALIPASVATVVAGKVSGWQTGGLTYFANQAFQEYWSGRFLLGQLPPEEADSQAGQFLAYEFADAAAADTLIERSILAYGEAEAVAHQLFTIRQVLGAIHFPMPECLGTTLITNPYLVRYEQYLLVCDGLEGLKSWLDQLLIGAVLGRQTPILENTQSPGHLFLYANPQQLKDYLGVAFSAFPAEYLKGPIWGLGQLREGRLHWSLQEPADFERSSDVQVKWRYTLESDAITAPAALEVGEAVLLLVQDVGHRLYAFDVQGRLLWKKPLEQRVLSDFQRVQLYESGLPQIAFNTASRLHVINQKGEDSPGYPLDLPATGINAMQVVHFDDYRDFAFFFSCVNENTYALDGSGQALPGWGPKEGLGRVDQAIQHFQLPEQDFIVVLSNNGLLHVLRRDGSNHFPPLALEGPFLNDPAVQVHPLSNRIVTVNLNGKATVVNTEGANFGLNLSVGKNEFVEFALEDVTGDTRRDYLVLSGTSLAGYRYEGQQFGRFLQHTFSEEQEGVFVVRDPAGGQPWIGTYSYETQELYLLRPDGQVEVGFPVAGNTPGVLFRPGGNGPLQLATAWLNELYVYEL